MKSTSVFCFIWGSAIPLFAGCMPAGELAGGGDSQGNSSRSIVGGTEATSYPEAALINIMQGDQLVSACSGAVIAPRVVLTAGHCVDGFQGWQIVTPYADNQVSWATSGAVFDYKNDSETVNVQQHDVGLLFLQQPIQLDEYPTIAEAALQTGDQVVNIGRIRDGYFSYSDVYMSHAVEITDGAEHGAPLYYVAEEIVQPGDSGGPDVLPGTHVIVAVNSGAGGGTEVLARVDLLAGWIKENIDAYGGTNAFGDPSGDPYGGGGDPYGGDPYGDPYGGGGYPEDPYGGGGDPYGGGDPNDPYGGGGDPNDPYGGGGDPYGGGGCGEDGGGQPPGGEDPYGGGGDPNDPYGGGQPPSGQDCGNVTYEGQCENGMLLYCDGALQMINCQQYGMQCALNQQAGYYDCM